MAYLSLFFLALPVIELVLFIKLGAQLGVLNVLLEIVLTAMLGMALIQRQGFGALLRANQKLATGDVPAEDVARGFLAAAGGVALFLPGFLTDAIGVLLQLPPLRKWLAGRMMRFLVVAENGQQSFVFRQTSYHYQDGRFQQGDTIDGEFTEVEQKTERLEKK